MKRYVLLPFLAFSLVALAACNQATNTLSSSSPFATGSAAASARASASVAASAPASASAGSKYIDLNVAVPQPNSNAGVNGMGWTVDVIAKGTGPAMDKVKPAFQSTSSTATGRNTNFPGLVVLLKSSSGASGNANQNANLAKLFQVIGLPNAVSNGAGISSVGSNASASPMSSASGSTSASSSPGTAATGSGASATADTAEATWFVQSAMFGQDADVTLTVFVVDGDAPDTVSDMNNLNIVSNTVTVTFHINGGATSPGGTARPSGSAAPSGSTAPSGTPGGASPSASATP